VRGGDPVDVRETRAANLKSADRSDLADGHSYAET
jgi:hypothetical protein